MMKYTTLMTLALGLLWLTNAQAYQSSYDLIQWDQRDSDTYYCIDITDTDWRVYEGLQALQCGENLYEFSPRAFVESLGIALPQGFAFRWRVWSQAGYGGHGFEGEIVVGQACGLPYRSDSSGVQWGCRFSDVHYCVDLFNAEGASVAGPLQCGDHLHSIDFNALAERDLPAGTYHWKVWSPTAYNYVGGNYFEGTQPRFLSGHFTYGADNTDLATPSVDSSNFSGSYLLTSTHPRMEGNCQATELLLGCRTAAECLGGEVLTSTVHVQHQDNQILMSTENLGSLGSSLLGGDLQGTVQTDGSFSATNTQSAGLNADCTLTMTSASQHRFVENRIDNGTLHSHILIQGSQCFGFEMDCHAYADFTGVK